MAHLLGYDYSIHYRTSQSNAAEDALSRRTKAPFTQLFLLTVINYLFLQELKQELLHNSAFLEFRQQIQADPSKYPDSSIRDDFILQNGRIWLPKGLHVIPTILAEFHNTPTGGHMGIAKTLGRINENFV